MRQLRKRQLGLFDPHLDHPLSQELQRISHIIDRHPEFALCVHEDLVHDKTERGDIGLTAEQVLKAP